MMRNLPPPFQFEVASLVQKARRQLHKRVEGVTINLPFVSFSVRPDDLERKVAKEVVIRLADKRVLNAFECCDSCIEKALASLREIRSLIVDKQVDLANLTDGSLYLILEFMLEGIRQFFTFEEQLRTDVDDFPGALRARMHRHDLQPYFAALEMLRGHLYRCMTQVAAIADIPIPRIADNMRYDTSWQIEAYSKPAEIGEKSPGSGMQQSM